LEAKIKTFIAFIANCITGVKILDFFNVHKVFWDLIFCRYSKLSKCLMERKLLIAGDIKFFRLHLHSVPRSLAEDERRPLGAGLQEQASNHLNLLWPKATVVSVEEKSRHQIAAGRTQRDERKRTIR